MGWVEVALVSIVLVVVVVGWVLTLGRGGGDQLPSGRPPSRRSGH